MGNAFTDKPFFNTDFIKENKLKKLKGTYVYKKRDEPMQTTEYNYAFEFNSEGMLVATFETRKDDGSIDTTWNKYNYNKKGLLTRHRKTDQEGYLTTNYQYDSLDRVVNEEILRELIDSSGNIVRTLTFNFERFEYSVYDGQTKRTKYNNYDLPYLEEMMYYNEDGYLVERIERIKMTSKVFTYHYEYNDRGLLGAVRKSSNRSEGYLEEWLFEYDEYGNLVEKKVYKNGEFITDYQIIYNSKSKLLATVITRQVSTNFMMILRFFDYEFFD